MDGHYWSHLIQPRYEGSRFIVVAELLATALPQVEWLLDQGAQRPFVIAAARGVGDIPSDEQAETALLDLDLPPDAGSRFMPFLRALDAAVGDLPPDLLGRIDAWDPAGEARVLAPFLLGGVAIGGRRPFGGRRPEWIALENKMTVDRFWDEAGVRRAPSRILPLEVEGLAAAAAELDWGHGTVWVGDNREGWHGGAEYLRWVRGPAHAPEAYSFFRGHCDAVRIMPFLEGIPCSIHGIVFDDVVIAVRPFEMLVLVVEGGDEMKYVGSASFWDPDAADRRDLRGIARRVGHHLAATVAYRGVFTVDGVMTRWGFLPTELNPRFGAGLGRAVRDLEGLSILAVHRSLTEGHDLDYRPADLESVLVEHSDANRYAAAFYQVPESPEAPIEVFLEATPDGMVPASEATAHAVATWGGGIVGGAVAVRLLADRTDAGPSAAPRIAEAFGYARRNWPITMPMLRTIETAL